MSSALADVKVYSSPLTVVSVKLELSVLVVLQRNKKRLSKIKNFRNPTSPTVINYGRIV